MKFETEYKKMSLAERRIQNECLFTLDWINTFVNEYIRVGLLKLARRVVYLEKEIRRLRKELAKYKFVG